MKEYSIQSVLNSAGPQAGRIEQLWWLMFWVCTVVFVIVMLALAVAIARGRRGSATAVPESTLTRNISISVGVSTVALVGLLLASVLTGRALGSLPSSNALHVRITGYQWWWNIEYLDADPSLQFTTANELHLPVGRPVVVSLQASDVIHSFWVPNLHGKTDLIPGRENTLLLQADTPGVFRGQCAEYCGVQHAHMAFTVVAEPSEQFEGWLSAQRKPAPDPGSAQTARGRNVVEQGPCAMCHTIRGTNAGARTAPDLTHFATRSTIAAGTAPNTRGYLAGWIADPQHLKPGSRMPPTGLSSDDLQAVIAYLETLQ
ncbi:MAG: cytochrome c oxidase subunit [Acidobacteriota bacterium]|jgi:cytochrome c oxidase subunit 2